MVSDERSEEFRRSVKESLNGPFQATGSDDTEPEIGIERKNKLMAGRRRLYDPTGPLQIPDFAA